MSKKKKVIAVEPVAPKVKRKYTKKIKPLETEQTAKSKPHRKDGHTYYIYEQKKGQKVPVMFTFTEYCDRVANLVEQLERTSFGAKYTVVKEKTRADLL